MSFYVNYCGVSWALLATSIICWLAKELLILLDVFRRIWKYQTLAQIDGYQTFKLIILTFHGSRDHIMLQ